MWMQSQIQRQSSPYCHWRETQLWRTWIYVIIMYNFQALYPSETWRDEMKKLPEHTENIWHKSVKKYGRQELSKSRRPYLKTLYNCASKTNHCSAKLERTFCKSAWAASIIVRFVTFLLLTTCNWRQHIPRNEKYFFSAIFWQAYISWHLLDNTDILLYKIQVFSYKSLWQNLFLRR